MSILVLSGFFTLLETLRSRFGHLTQHTAVLGLAVFLLPILDLKMKTSE